MLRMCVYVLIAMSFSGCITKSKIDKLVTLKKFEKVQNSTENFVDEESEFYKKLMKVYKAGKISEYPDQDAIFTAFAEPIRIKPVTRNGQQYESWLYRDPVEFFESDKLFLYFDASGKLIDTEFWAAPTPE